MRVRIVNIRQVVALLLFSLVVVGCAGSRRILWEDPSLKIKFAVSEVWADSSGTVRLPLVITNEGTEAVDLPMFDSCFQIGVFDTTIIACPDFPTFGHISDLSKREPILLPGETLKMNLTFTESFGEKDQIVREIQFIVDYKVGDKRSGKMIWRQFATHQPVTVRW